MFRTFALVICLSAIAASVAAQPVGLPPEGAGPREGVQTPRPAAAPAPTPTPPVPQDAPRKPLRGRDVNVHVEITITDQTGTAAPEKKVVSLLVADQTQGRVRANANARQKTEVGFVGTSLNVDAYPTVLDSDRVLLTLTIEYAPLRDTLVTQQPTTLNESITVILQTGKPLTISQAADPISDRRMTVDVKATIVK